MILRQIQLGEVKESWTPRTFNTKLQLWFDQFSKSEVQKLEDFLDAKYMLRGEQVHERVSGYRVVEFANHSFVQMRGKGNLFEECRILDDAVRGYDEKEGYDSKSILRRESNQKHLSTRSKFPSLDEYHAAVMECADVKAMQAKWRYLKDLRDASSSLFIDILDNPKNSYDVGLYGGPKDHDLKRPLEGPIVKLTYMPFDSQKDVVKELRNMLLGDCEMEYETPRHKEVLNGILSGEIQEYSRCALFEYRERERKFGESGERESSLGLGGLIEY
jgi:hypothetical protein